jgi:hypothetical protein
LLCISFFSFCFVSGPFINQNIFLWFECSAFVSQTVYITIRCVFSNSENYKMSNRNNLSLLNIYFRIVTWIWIFCICVSPSPLVEEELSTLPEYLCSQSGLTAYQKQNKNENGGKTLTWLAALSFPFTICHI